MGHPGADVEAGSLARALAELERLSARVTELEERLSEADRRAGAGTGAARRTAEPEGKPWEQPHTTRHETLALGRPKELPAAESAPGRDASREPSPGLPPGGSRADGGPGGVGGGRADGVVRAGGGSMRRSESASRLDALAPSRASPAGWAGLPLPRVPSDSRLSLSDVPMEATQVVMTQIVSPADSFGSEICAGGTVLSWIDVAAGIAAKSLSRMPVVTASVDEVHFLRPCHVRGVVTVTAAVNRVFNSSMEIGVRVEEEDEGSGEPRHCCSAFLTFVALGPRAQQAPAGAPKLPPQVHPTDRESEAVFSAAAERRLARLEARRARGAAARAGGWSERGLAPLAARASKGEGTGGAHARLDGGALGAARALASAARADRADRDRDRARARLAQAVSQLGRGEGAGPKAPADEVLEPEPLRAPSEEGDRAGVPIDDENARSRSRGHLSEGPGDGLGDGAAPSPRSSGEMERAPSPGTLAETPEGPERLSGPPHVPAALVPSRYSIPASATASHGTQLILPQHANSIGITFGGVVMRWMEGVAWVCARRVARGAYVLTAALDQLDFALPTRVGDVLYVEARATAIFGSSVEVLVSAWAETPEEGVPRECVRAYATVVSMDADGSPREIPFVLFPDEPDDEARAAGAAERRARRLRTRAALREAAALREEEARLERESGGFLGLGLATKGLPP